MSFLYVLAICLVRNDPRESDWKSLCTGEASVLGVRARLRCKSDYPKLNGIPSVAYLRFHPFSTGCVSCLEHDEHYILIPNGYGRQVEQFRSSDA